VREVYDTDSFAFTLLTRAQDRRLRALAWKHIRRINPQTARALWRKVRHR